MSNNTKLMHVVLSFLFVSAAFIPENAWAFRFSLVGTGLYDGFESGEIHSQPRLGLGGGALAEFPLKKGPFSIEIGALYLTRKDLTAGVLYSAPMVQVPVVFRVWAGRVLTLGAGFYYGQGIGKVTTESGGVSTQVEYSDIGQRKGDFGAVGAAGFNVPLGGVWSLLLEGRYTFGLYNLSTVQDVTTKYNDIQAFFGVRIGRFGSSRY